eukprot:1800400-Rhodomonas_salina.2
MMMMMMMMMNRPLFAFFFLYHDRQKAVVSPSMRFPVLTRTLALARPGGNMGDGGHVPHVFPLPRTDHGAADLGLRKEEGEGRCWEGALAGEHNDFVSCLLKRLVTGCIRLLLVSTLAPDLFLRRRRRDSPAWGVRH